MASEEKNSSKLKFLNWILYGAIAIFIILVIAYFIFIIKLDDAQKGNWGTFGDFIGGTLNPLFALFSLFAIIYTIKIQTRELELSREELEATREELKGSRIAQQEQSESLKLQNEATKLQMFENTFFKLIELKISLVDSLSIEIIINQSSMELVKGIAIKDAKGFKGKSSLKMEKDIVISNYMGIIKNYKSYDEFYSNYIIYIEKYIETINQTLQFINDSSIENKQRYVNIFRTQFTKDELELLFYHCLGTIGKKRFKKLAEDYEFFEHIILNADIKKQLLEYDKAAFGKNEKILEAYNKLKEEKL